MRNEQAVFNTHDAQKYAALYALDAVGVSLEPRGLEEQRGRAAVQKSFGELFSAFHHLDVIAHREDTEMSYFAAFKTTPG